MEVNFNFNINPIVVKLDVNPQFTQSICFLASAFGYPAKTIANELKETAKDIKQKTEEPKQEEKKEQPKQEQVEQEQTKQEQTKQEVKKDVKVWTSEELVNLCNDLCCKQKVITLDDLKRLLKKFKNKNGNPVTRVQELDFEKVEEVNEFVRIINEQASLQKANILSEK